VYLSGYGLLDPGARAAILGWLDRLGGPNVVFFDPGPLVVTMPAGVLDRVLRRADWVTCNAREAALITGRDDPPGAARALAQASREGSGRRRRRTGGALVRTGAAGCVVGLAGAAAPVHVPGFPVDAVDTNGAGDTHTGTFAAALARGMHALEAARTANAAAALSVTRHGPATAPSAAELARFLALR
jgi:sugar/nucleoside kinase (ribokinase family)